MTRLAQGAMPTYLVVAKILGLGAPELIVVLVVLLVLFSGCAWSGVGDGGARRGADPGLTRYEKQILIALAAVSAAGIVTVVWQGARR